MKLHLPKQLFTALLAAITLATPATLTLGSTAWGAAAFTTSDDGTTATYSGTANDMQFSEIGSDVDKVILNTSGGWLTNTNLNADVLVQIGADGNNGTTGLVLSDGGGSTYTIANKVIGSGSIKKTGRGTNMVLEFTGDVSEYTGNIELGATVAFNLRFGNAGVSAVSSETNGASGTGTITFTNSNNTLKYAYAASETPVYITNVITTSGSGQAKMEISNGADYVFTKDVTVNALTAGADSTLTFNGALTLNGTVAVQESITANGTVTLGAGVVFDLSKLERVDGVYTLFSGSTTVDLSGVNLTGTKGSWTYTAQNNGTVLATFLGKTVTWNGDGDDSANFEWGEGTTFAEGSAFATYDNVNITGSDDIKLTSAISANQVTIGAAEGADITVSFTSDSNELKVQDGFVIRDGATVEVNKTTGTTGFIQGEVTIENGGVLKFNATDVTGHSGGATSMHTINVQAGGELQLNITGNETFAGTLNLDGTLKGVHTGGPARFDMYGGKATIKVGANATASMENINLQLRQNDSVITVGNNATLSLSGTITKNEGNGVLYKNGAGSMVVGGNVTNLTLNIGAGTMGLQGGASNTNVNIANGSTLTLGKEGAANATTYTIGTLTGADGKVTIERNATLSLSGGTADAQKQHSIGTLTVANGGKLNLAAHSALTLGSSHTVTYLVSGAGELVVEDGVILTLANGDNPPNKRFDTNVRIKDGGRMVFTGLNYSDQLNYDNHSRTVYLEGTAELALGNTRQTVGYWTFDMTGGTISGQGQSNNAYALDFHNTGYIKAHAAADATAENPTVSTVSANIKNREGSDQLNLVADANARLNLSGNLSLVNPVEKSGAGLAVISGTVTRLGEVDVTGGTLELQSSDSTASDISVSSGAELEISAGTSTLSGAVTNDGAITVSGGSATLSGTVTNNGAITVSGGSATLSGAVTNNGAITVSGGTADFTNTLGMETGSSLSVSGGSATVSGALNVTGTGVQIGQSGNGVLDLAGSFNVGEGASATLSGSVGIAHTITNNGSLTLNGSIYLSGDVTLGDYVVREAAGERGLYVLDYTDTDTTNSEGNGFKLTSGGSYWLVQGGETDLNGLEKLNGYTVTKVTDANKADGDRVGDVYISSEYNVGKEFYISSGSVEVDANVQAAATGYTMADKTTMNVTEGSVAAHTITFNGDNTINLAQSAQLYIGQAYGSNTFDHTLTGTGTVVVDRELAFSGEYLEFFTGTADINSGALYVGPYPSGTEGGSAASVGASKFIVRKDAALWLNMGGANETLAASLDMLSGSALSNRDGDNILTGNIRFNIVDPSAAEVAYNADGTVRLTQHWPKNIKLSGVLSGAGVVEMSAHGAGVAGTASSWVLTNNDNTFVGSYNLVDSSINSTTKLVLAAEYAAQYATINLLSSNSTETARTHLELQQNATIKGLNSTGAANYVTTTAASDTTLTVSEGAFAGILKDGSNAALSLTKTGEGTLTLSGANTYTGATRVEGGELVVTKANADTSSSYHIAQDATLKVNAFTGSWNKTITGDGTLSLVIGSTGDHANNLKGAGGFNGVLEISKDTSSSSQGNTNLLDYDLGTGASLKLVSGNHWGNGTITRAIELAGTAENHFEFKHDDTLELSGKVTGTYMTTGRNYNNTQDNTLILSGAGSEIEHVIVSGEGILRVNNNMSFGTVTAGTMNVGAGYTLTLGTGTSETEQSITQLNASEATVQLLNQTELALGGGSAEAQKQHSIGTLSAAAAGVTLGDYATLTLGGGTEENPVTHSIGTLTGGTGSMLNLAQHSVLNTITSASGVTLTGSGTYKLASGTSTMTSGMTLGEDWMGTVVVENSIGKKDITKALNALGNSESTVQVTNLEGYFETARSGVVGVVDPNLHLVNGTNGESAIKIINGNCNGVNAVIAGDISGSGDITHQAWVGANDRYANYEFTGNVTQWTGNFIVGDSSSSGHANVIFSGSATKINAGFRMDDDANKLHLQIGKSDETDKQYEVNGVVSANALTAYQSADFTKEVTVGNAVTVSAGKTATFGSTLTANTVNNSGQIQLGKIVTNGEEKEMQVVATVAGGSMSKVQMSSTGITSTAQDGSSSISDADIEVLAQDASFTIEDMTLSQVKLSAAQGTTVVLNNVSGTAELAGAGNYTLGMVGAMENDNGGTALTLKYTSDLAITMSGTGSQLLLSADPTADVNGVFGTYNLTLTLNYALDGELVASPADTIDWQELVGFTGILGDLLTAQTPEATVDLAEGEAAVAAADTTPTVEYNYTAPQGDAQVGTLVITINGLNVPEPASATLGLAALMMLCARRRRKA